MVTGGWEPLDEHAKKTCVQALVFRFRTQALALAFRFGARASLRMSRVCLVCVSCVSPLALPAQTREPTRSLSRQITKRSTS